MKIVHHENQDTIFIDEKSYSLRLVRLIHPTYSLPKHASLRYYDTDENIHFLIYNRNFQLNQPIFWEEGEFLFSRTPDLDRLSRMPLEDIEFLEEQQKKNLHTNVSYQESIK
jgi:hypothetical protein